MKHLKLIRVLINAFMWLKKHLPALHPKHLVGLLDWYIIKKFIGTYVFSIIEDFHCVKSPFSICSRASVTKRR